MKTSALSIWGNMSQIKQSVNFIARRLNKTLLIIFITASSAFSLIHMHLYNPTIDNLYDARQNLVAAYNIARHHTYSINHFEPHPGSAREPLYPALIGGMMKLKMILGHHTDLDLLKNFSINKFKLLNVAMLFSTIFLACFFVYRQTKNHFLVAYCAFTLVFTSSLATLAHAFLSEDLAAILSLIMAILLFNAQKMSEKRSYYIGLGLCMSALVLTKAIFLYFIPILIIYLNIVNLKKLKTFDKKYVFNMFLFASCILIFVGGWMLRNYIHFDRAMIADRKAEILSVRAKYDALSPQEYPYVYAVWAPGLSKYFLHKDTEKDWWRLENRVGNDQVIMDVMAKEIPDYFLNKILNPSWSYDQADYIILENIAIRKILANPIGHLKLTIAFLYRSIFTEDGSGLEYLGIHLPHEKNGDKRVDSFMLAVLVNIPIWSCFFYAIFYAIRRKKINLFGLILIPSYIVMAYSGLAFSHPRYIEPVIPSLNIIFCLVINQLLIRIRSYSKTTSIHAIQQVSG